MKHLLVVIMAGVVFVSCKNQTAENKMDKVVAQVLDSLSAKYGEDVKAKAEKGIAQAANFWTEADGAEVDFVKFCIANYIANDTMRQQVFLKLNDYFEATSGNFNSMSLELQRQVHLDLGPVLPIDEMFSAYSPSSHLDDDLFANKIAFYVIINFPKYLLQEKNELGAKWTTQEWAYARMGDMFDSRVPANLQQDIANKLADADLYISQYNIFAGQLVNDKNQTLFPKEMKLLSHWNIRDEIKANYNKDGGLVKQEMLYQVMKRIINQDIPAEVIDNDNYQWNPLTNKVYENAKEVTANAEPNTRYQKMLNNFNSYKAVDKNYTGLDTYVKRAFEGDIEMPQEDVEKLFVEFLSSKEVKEVAAVIKARLGHNLQPFDLWYDGFKARSTISVEKLDNSAQTKYPTCEAFKKDIPNILQKLSFSKQKAEFIASKVNVEAARGSGHAWGAGMHSMNSYLRTRVGANGMDYKGYNIAMHEFGHTVEQTISMHDVQYFAMTGVPNTAFTEALAFIFQRRDMDMMGIKDNNPDKDALTTLDNFWSLYEIMGVSVVDMHVWKWMYEHPQATSAQLKDAVVEIAKDVWNKYYAEAFGVKDEPILAIYSHMVSYPLYLSNYALGHLIDFQLEQQFAGKSFGAEVERVFSQGRLTPKYWMLKATGKEISNQPVLDAVDKALGELK